MNNISWGTFGASKKAEVKEKYVIPNQELLECKTKLIDECNNLICGLEELYCKSSSKEVYDSIMTLQSAKKSLNSIYVKETVND
jgi:hypothetical protein